jgi:hypothetical protein
MGGAAKGSSGRQRSGQAAAVGKVLGDVAGEGAGHPSEPSGIVHVAIHLQSAYLICPNIKVLLANLILLRYTQPNRDQRLLYSR